MKLSDLWYVTHIYAGEEVITVNDEHGKSVGLGSFTSREAADHVCHLHNTFPLLREVVGWAESALELYGFNSDYQDPMHQLACAVRDYNKTITKPEGGVSHE